MSTRCDGIALLRAIKTTSFQFQQQKHPCISIHISKRKLYVLSQQEHMSNHYYFQKFKNTVDVLEANGGSIGDDPLLINQILQRTRPRATMETASRTMINEAKEEAKQEYLAVAFLMGADRSRYGLLIQSLENDYIQGVNKYPKNLVDAYHLITNWKHDTRHYTKGTNEDEVTFAQDTDRLANVTCY